MFASRLDLLLIKPLFLFCLCFSTSPKSRKIIEILILYSTDLVAIFPQLHTGLHCFPTCTLFYTPPKVSASGLHLISLNIFVPSLFCPMPTLHTGAAKGQQLQISFAFYSLSLSRSALVYATVLLPLEVSCYDVRCVQSSAFA